MQRGKFFVRLLVGVMSIILLLSGCSSKDTSNLKGDTGTTKLTVAFPVLTSVPKNLKEVQDEVNKITSKKIGATVKLVPISFGAWNQQTNLMLSGNEKVDLIAVLGDQYSAIVSKGQLQALDKLLDQKGKDIKNALGPDYITATKVKNQIYAVPSVRDLAQGYGVMLRKDLLDKNNIDPSSIKTLDDLEETLKTVQEKDPDAKLLAPAGKSIVNSLPFFDPLGDKIGVLPNYDNNLKVVNLYETPEYAELLNKVHSFYKKGYIFADIATNQESQFDLIKANRGIGYVGSQKPGIAGQDTRNAGQPMVQISLEPPVATTYSVTKAMWGIPHSSKNPEKSMEFLNLLYSDKEVINLLDWGIEGKDYEKKSGNIIAYPPGITAETVQYNLNQPWLFGNSFLSYIFEGEDPDLWKKTKEFNNTAIKSKALGFTFDSSSVKTELSAVQNVVSQYELVLETGTLDPKTKLPEFISRLKAAGIDKIIAEKQKQLDEWAKNQ